MIEEEIAGAAEAFADYTYAAGEHGQVDNAFFADTQKVSLL